MSMQNASLKKMNPKIQFQKSKTNKLLLTDFNKFSLFNYSLKQSKKKLNITNQTNTNNSVKNQKSINTSNNNTNVKNNYLNNISYNNNNDFTIKNQNKISNTSKNELKQILYNNNNNSKSIKYNSVNNLIGINISVNYLNKNYTLNKMKQPNFCTSIYSNYSSKNLKNNQQQKKNNNINDNYYNKYISESFNEINKGNNSYFNSSGKNRINKKKRFIMNPTQNDFQNIIDNLKYKSINKNNNSSVNKIQNQIEIKNTISSTDENNNNNNNKLYFNSPHKIMGIEKSLSCKHINNNSQNNNDNTYHNHRYKNPGNKNIYKVLMNFLDKKINKLKDNIINNNNNNKEYTDDEKLYDIINEFFIKYCNSLDDQFQKELIVNIFYLINNIINRRDKQIQILKKEKENIMEKNNLYVQNNEELMEQNNSLMSKCNIMQNKIEELKSEIDMYKKDFINKKKENNLNIDIKLNNKDISSDNNEENSQNHSSSSYVNTEELESIRFFDKIEMKKHSFMNIPELSFQKIKLDEFKRDKKPIKKKNSFQTKNPYIKKTKNNIDNLKRINKKIVYCNNSNILPKYKQKLNMNHKQNNNLSGNKINAMNINNKPNIIGYLFVPDFKKGIEVKKAK
jgi:hypothetical protein